MFGVIAWLLLVAGPQSVFATPVATRSGSPPVLQVPYLAQSELLCGGAAIAMVERWWGRRGVYAEDFAHLVLPGAPGIRTTDLAEATHARGWQTAVVPGTPAVVERALRDSVPVVALIRVDTDRYHYVVIVGWNAEQVVYHDPAVRPFATLPTSDFLQRWQEADGWALLIRPALAAPDRIVPPVDHPAPTPPDSLPCRPWLDRAVDAVLANQLDSAERLLDDARRACPAEAMVLREQAGLRFRQTRYLEAAQLAAEFVAQVPHDSLGWQLLASSRYLAGNSEGALDAWNMIGRPTVDLVIIEGSDRVRFRAILDAMGVSPGIVLTADRLALAQRRVADLPALRGGRLSYAVIPGGAVEVRVAIVESPTVPAWTHLFLGGMTRAVVRQEAALALASPLGVGERWVAEWRWDDAEPRRAIRAEIPTRLGRPGIVAFEESSEEYRLEARPERRRATTVGFRSWLHGSVEALADVRSERWSTEGDFLALSVGAAMHGWRDRVAVIGQVERAVALGDQDGYTSFLARAAWHSKNRSSAVEWSARLGVDAVSVTAPRGLWPLAGGDLTRAIPLRAHSRVVAGSLSADRSAPTVLHGGVAADRHATFLGPLDVAVGLFLDAARVMASDRQLNLLDAGIGLRIGVLGAPSTALRLDLARALLADKRWGVSVGLQQSWPLRLHESR